MKPTLAIALFLVLAAISYANSATTDRKQLECRPVGESCDFNSDEPNNCCSGMCSENNICAPKGVSRAEARCYPECMRLRSGRQCKGAGEYCYHYFGEVNEDCCSGLCSENNVCAPSGVSRRQARCYPECMRL